MQRRREWLRGAAALAAASAWPLRAAEEEAFETLDIDWADSRRQRPVPVRLYLPQGGGPVPLVVFSHGIGGSRRGYSWLGQHFARHDIAGLHLQHVGSDRQLWTGSIFSVLGRLQTPPATCACCRWRRTRPRGLASRCSSRGCG